MKITFLKWLFLFALTISAVSCLRAQVAETTVEKALLWEISGNDLVAPSYLFGTIHIINKEDFFWPKGTQEALKTADRITFEIDMAVMNDPSMMFSMMNSVMMKGGQTLKSLLSEEDYATVSKAFESKGLPMFLLEKVKPMFLTIMVGEEFSMDALQDGFGGGDIMSYEMEFMKLAQDQEKETGGLETVEFQMGLFDSIPYEAQAQMLVETIKEGGNEEEEDMLSKMVELYKQQDIHGLDKMMHEDGGEAMGMDEYGDLLLGGRNRAWIPIMEKMMREKPTFFAVGAGHLPGEMGVIQLLRSAGYTVTPLSL